MKLSRFCASLALVGVTCARGGGRGGGGGSSSGGGSGGGGSSSTLYYSAFDCWGLDVNPTIDSDTACTRRSKGICREGFAVLNEWIYDDASMGRAYSGAYREGRDNSSRNTLTPSSNTNWMFDIYDAYYNGSFSITLEPDSNNQTLSSCATFKSHELDDGYLRIGAIARDNNTRSFFDPNPYFFQFGRTFPGDKCPDTPNKLFASFQSSNDNLQAPSAWNLTAQKKDGKFQLGGSIGSSLANFNNYYNYLANKTDVGYPALNGTVLSKCPTYFKKRTLTSANQVKMDATVDASTASMTWSFIDPTSGYKITGSFKGKAWEKGAKLDMASNSIVTTGQSKRIIPPKPKNFWMDNLKWFILAAVILILVLLGTCIFCCCRSIFTTCCLRRKQKKAQHQYAKAAQTEDYSYRG